MNDFDVNKKILELRLKELKALNKKKIDEERRNSPLIWFLIVLCIFLMYWS
jgi:hypothetical protein